MLKLHFAPGSRAERIMWLLEELELPYDLNSMAFHPEASKKTPTRQVSCLRRWRCKHL